MLLVFFITLGLWTPGGVKAAGTTPEEILASMTTKEKISQMMVVSMEGSSGYENSHQKEYHICLYLRFEVFQ